jgi:hypothetical protein
VALSGRWSMSMYSADYKVGRSCDRPIQSVYGFLICYLPSSIGVLMTRVTLAIIGLMENSVIGSAVPRSAQRNSSPLFYLQFDLPRAQFESFLSSKTSILKFQTVEPYSTLLQSIRTIAMKLYQDQGNVRNRHDGCFGPMVRYQSHRLR